MVQLQVLPASAVLLIQVTLFSAYESLPDSGSGAGPQRSVEGWVVFVTGIYEETQVLIEVAPSTESDASAQCCICCLLVCLSVLPLALRPSPHARISRNSPCLQDEDVMDKFGEYGTVKAGNACACGIASPCFSHVGLQ